MIFNLLRQKKEKVLDEAEIEDLRWISNLHKWNDDWGDVTRRINYNLNPDSIVFDIGGYKGQWASDIYAKYGCNLYIFEPIRKYATFIKSRLNFPTKIVVEPVGASTHNHSEYLYIDNEKSSTNINSQAEKSVKVKVKMIDLCSYIHSKNINSIDLMKINIEGDEYDLLNKIISTGTINKISNIQIQFHRFINESKNMRAAIRKLLRKTHKEIYNYPFIWESWELKHVNKRR